MEGGFWRILLVVGAVSASGPSPPPHKPLTYEEAVGFGVELYNEKAGEDALFRLLEAAPQPEWDPTSEGVQELNFTIKETVCLVEDERAEGECDFKDDGLVKECSGYYFLDKMPAVAVLTCETVGGKVEEKEEEEKHQPKRVKRFQNFFRKLEEAFRKFFRKHQIVIGFGIRF
ncbi:cathelicidin-related peptide Oh-Cath-like isoform X1 [Candoia aspera]|uniref:cathelicidin-related peptide Oh-Cath-like isoform X1 n=1 Tax=Candoia aspera TaxID=51853 RepID=UPI002FD8633D